METSSRIFTRNLPPNLSDSDFRKHFAQRFPSSITDLKLFPQRRIGYVGFKTSEDAKTAVKYFNKSFIRMSRIYVELANAPTPSITKPAPPTAKKHDAITNLDVRHTDDSLKRKRGEKEDADDPKLREFLDAMKPPSKKTWTEDASHPKVDAIEQKLDEDVSEGIPTRERMPQKDGGSAHNPADAAVTQVPPQQNASVEDHKPGIPPDDQAQIDDMDWMRSRTSRLLGLVDDDEEQKVSLLRSQAPAEAENERPRIVQELTPPPEDGPASGKEDCENVPSEINTIRESGRLFLRNLPYTAQEEDLRQLFEQKGALQEVHVPLDSKSGTAKGFAFVHYNDPEHAVQAYYDFDGATFQGRLLHVLPAAAKRENKLDEFAISKLPVKKQKLLEKKAQASASTFNWNSLYMNTDAVMSSIADRLGTSKSELFDPTSSDAGVKQAQAETHVIQETKAFFEENGVDLNAFARKERGDTGILIKNFPYGTTADDLKTLFGEVGEVSRVLMPPSGTIAIVEFPHKIQARTAFATFSYRKYKDSVLFLEKAPKDLFKPGQSSNARSKTVTGLTLEEGEPAKLSTSDLLQPEQRDEQSETSTLFVRNLNFTTTNERLEETFKPLSGFMSARIKTKTDPKKPGQVLSMGFGFVEFRSAEQAQAALQAIDGHNLDGHHLIVKASHKGSDAAEARRKEDNVKKQNARKSKLIIKNLPFETSKKDVRALFKTYGQLRSVRVPNKFDGTRKGYAFAEFTTPKEAENAMDALRNTHFLGRRLVLDYAAGDAEDAEAEIAKMQEKVGRQTSSVAMKRLTSTSERKKFNLEETNEETVG
ncbi:hypothetical protein FH972_025226 [Carpinus fangiana]|uniref:Multiple RNA-binding domain-containing protein 1 n=1 Tax=Carpinus fangiana TaxID=176857 RepID=A0A5N6L0E0_9ROSI|nr:hypothetical protein FH972_025226 [Carpinus fangiana]